MFIEIKFTPCDDCPLVGEKIQVDEGNTLALTDVGGLKQTGELYRHIHSDEIEYYHPELAETIKKCGGAILGQCPAEPLVRSIQPFTHFPLPRQRVIDGKTIEVDYS